MALATPSRVRILSELRQGACAGTTPPRPSRWGRRCLASATILRHLGLVVGERHGRSVVYDYRPRTSPTCSSKPCFTWSIPPGPLKPSRRAVTSHAHDHDHDHHHGHDHSHGEHGHSHGLVDRSIVRSRAGVKAVAISLAILGVAAGLQLAIFMLTNSVALLADLIHNFGDALTAVPLGIAFFLRSFRGEKLAGLAVVAAIFISACVALYATVMRFIHPQDLTHLWALTAAGATASSGTSSPRGCDCARAGASRAPR